MSTERILRIKERLFEEFEHKKDFWCKDTTILGDPEVEKKPLVIRKALAIDYLLNNIPIIIRDYELIVGMANKGDWEFGFVFPSYALPEEKERAAEFGLTELSVFGHHPVNYGKMLELGLNGYRALILQKHEQAVIDGEQEKIDEYEAMLISLDAVSQFAGRYARHALELATLENDPARKKELLEIYLNLVRVPDNPPETFYQALQLFWIVYAALHSCIECVPAGRTDQYLYPYYKRDIESGKITVDEAKVLLAAWLAKFSDKFQMNSEDYEYSPAGPNYEYYSGPEEKRHWGSAANAWLMNMILGGQTEDGEDAVNELSYLILEVWNQLELVSPVMSVRICEKTPESFIDACSSILRYGSGEPAIYNDAPIIAGLVNRGIPLKDARNYANDGCTEILIGGCSEEAFDFVSIIQALEYTLFRGKSLMRDKQESLDVGDPTVFQHFDEFYEAFLKVMLHEIDVKNIDKRRNIFEKAWTIAPDPLLSVFMDDCIEKGKDIANGGARYSFCAPMLVGLANAVDSLAAIKKFVYEEKQITMETLLYALKTDFADHEALRLKLINDVPKFGNDNDYVDQIAVRLLKDIADHVQRREKEFPRLIMPIGIGTFERYVFFGLQMGASADGRHAEETLASNYSPAPGRDEDSVTAVLHSISKADLLPYVHGCTVDVQLNSNEYRGEAGIKRLSAIIRSACELGGVLFTFSGIDEKALRDAQIHPEKYKGLRVRYGGYSGYFINMPKEHQDIVIKRIKHS